MWFNIDTRGHTLVFKTPGHKGLRAISFVKLISRNMVCVICFLEIVLHNLLFACLCNLLHEICFVQFAFCNLPWTALHCSLWICQEDVETLKWIKHKDTGELLELLLHLKLGKFGNISILEFWKDVWIPIKSQCIDIIRRVQTIYV